MTQGHAVTVFRAFYNCRRPLEHHEDEDPEHKVSLEVFQIFEKSKFDFIDTFLSNGHSNARNALMRSVFPIYQGR